MERFWDLLIVELCPGARFPTAGWCSKEGGSIEQLLHYRDAVAADFLAARTLKEEVAEYSWPSVLLGIFRCVEKRRRESRKAVGVFTLPADRVLASSASSP